MIAWEVAKKYANALFLSARDKGNMQQVYEQLNDLNVIIEKDDLLLTFLGAPQILVEEKRSLIQKVFGSHMDRLLLEFMYVLVNKNRVAYLAEIIDEFTRHVEAEKGLGRVTVISAVPLSDGERNKLIEKMKLKTGLKIVLEEKVSTSILAGMIIILHNEIIDGSVRRELDVLKEQLNKVRVH